MAKMSKKDMLDSMEIKNWETNLTEQDSYKKIKDEFDFAKENYFITIRDMLDIMEEKNWNYKHIEEYSYENVKVEFEIFKDELEIHGTYKKIEDDEIYLVE